MCRETKRSLVWTTTVCKLFSNRRHRYKLAPVILENVDRVSQHLLNCGATNLECCRVSEQLHRVSTDALLLNCFDSMYLGLDRTLEYSLLFSFLPYDCSIPKYGSPDTLCVCVHPLSLSFYNSFFTYLHPALTLKKNI